MSAKTITFSITENDIQNGKKYDCELCPIGLAINRRLKEGWSCQVTREYLHFYEMSCHHPVFVLSAFALPNKIQGIDFITLFDSELPYSKGITDKVIRPFEISYEITESRYDQMFKEE